MTISLQQFLEKYNGKYVEAGGSANALNQCVDLANQYIEEVLGLSKILWTNAIDFPSKAGDNYEYILNTPTGVPQEGDLVIWGGNQYGHIAIFLEGDVNSFKSFDQNYPTGSPCHVQGHSYSNVLGWLRAKQIPQTDQQALIDQLRQERDLNWNKYLELKAVCDGHIEELKHYNVFRDTLADVLKCDNQLPAILGAVDRFLTIEDQLLLSQKEVEPLKQELQKSEEVIKGMEIANEDLKRKIAVYSDVEKANIELRKTIESLQKQLEKQPKCTIILALRNLVKKYG